MVSLHFPLKRLQFAKQNLQKGRLSDTVWSHNRNPAVHVDAEVGFPEQRLVSIEGKIHICKTKMNNGPRTTDNQIPLAYCAFQESAAATEADRGI